MEDCVQKPNFGEASYAAGEVGGGGREAEAAEGGGGVVGGGAVGLHAGEGELEDERGVPKAGAFVHVFVEPFAAAGEVEVADEVGEVGVEGAEERYRALQEGRRHGGAEALEVVEAVGEEGVEAMDGGWGWLHWGGRGVEIFFLWGEFGRV